MDSMHGPILRIHAAREAIDALEKVMAPACDPMAHSVIPDHDADGAIIMRAMPVRRCEASWSIRVGEIGHNLRAALDNITCEVAKLTTPKPHKRTQFPIFLVDKAPLVKKGSTPTSFEKDGRMQIKSVAPGHAAMFENQQPFQPSNGGAADPLWMLKGMNDADKHRILNLTILATDSIKVNVWDKSGKQFVEKIVKPTQHKFVTGAPVFSIGPAYGGWDGFSQFDFEFTLEVRFGESDPAISDRPVIPTLRAMLDRVERIVWSFAPLFNREIPRQFLDKASA